MRGREGRKEGEEMEKVEGQAQVEKGSHKGRSDGRE